MANYTEMEITDDEFNQVIRNDDKLIIAVFFSESHMPCLMLTPIIDDLAEELEEVKFVKFNIEDHEDLASKHSVSNVPCLIAFKDKEEIGRIKGCSSADIIEEKIREFL